jgi:hypothetical protein
MDIQMVESMRASDYHRLSQTARRIARLMALRQACSIFSLCSDAEVPGRAKAQRAARSSTAMTRIRAAGTTQ